MANHQPNSVHARCRVWIVMFTLALGVAVIPPSSRADLTVGATREIPDGQLDYTPAVADLSPDSGQYAPRIPLEVLPAPAGQALSLALVYSAKRTNGPLGVGWGLSFESSIERKSKYGGIATMSADDTFWIDGQKLIEVEDGTYRTEQHDFTVYTKITRSSGITGWTALKDGFTRHYGFSAGVIGTIDANAVEYQNETSPAGTAAGTRQVRWHLSKTRTAFGTEFSYRYIIPEVGPNGVTARRHLPDKIIYAETSSGWNEVSFAYEERNDIRASYANGPKRTESKRLRSITVVRVAGTAAVARTPLDASVSHAYLLYYTDALHSPQSLLTEVKRQEVMPPLLPRPDPGTQSIARFSYADSETTWGGRVPIALIGAPPLPAIQPSEEYFTLALTADVNGDARPDLVVFNDICHIEALDPPGPGNDNRVAASDEFPVPNVSNSTV